jgi:hypothetical protein
MLSLVDQRRLRDGARALEASVEPAQTADEILRQLGAVHEGIAALQSLDDLGPEANAKAFRDEEELWKRMKALADRLTELDTKANCS